MKRPINEISSAVYAMMHSPFLSPVNTITCNDILIYIFNTNETTTFLLKQNSLNVIINNAITSINILLINR